MPIRSYTWQGKNELTPSQRKRPQFSGEYEAPAEPLEPEIYYGNMVVNVTRVETFAHECRWIKPNKGTLLRLQKPSMRWVCKCGFNAA